MGYQAHKIFVVSDRQEQRLCTVRDVAYGFLDKAGFAHLVSAVTEPAVNGRVTFTIAPDGSKEGWPEGGKMDAALVEFLEWLTAYRTPDDGEGYMPFAWGLYQFAADEHDDVWAIGNHHSFGNPPAHFARFANHDHGAI